MILPGKPGVLAIKKVTLLLLIALFVRFHSVRSLTLICFMSSRSLDYLKLVFNFLFYLCGQPWRVRYS